MKILKLNDTSSEIIPKNKINFLKSEIAENKKNMLYFITKNKIFNAKMALLDEIGEGNFKNFKILSFENLPELVFKNKGYPKNEVIDKIFETIFMYLASKKFKNTGKCFFNCFENFEIVPQMIELYYEFKINNLNLNFIKNNKLSENLKEKLAVFNELFDVFDNLISKEFYTKIDSLNMLCEIDKYQNFFTEDYSIIIDNILEINQQEKKIIELFIKKKLDVYVFLNDDSLKIIDFFNFQMTSIGQIAQNYKFQTELMNNPINDTQHSAITYLKDNLLSKKIRVFEYSTENIIFYSAINVYDEFNFVAKKIKKLMIEENFRLKDILIIQNAKKYSEILKNFLFQHNIVKNNENFTDILIRKILQLVINLFEIIDSNFSTEKILNYLKTGFACISEEEIFIIENYVSVWKNENWLKTFKCGGTGANLEALNKVRLEIIKPIFRFKQNILKTDGIVAALQAFFEQINLIDSMNNFAKLEEVDLNNIFLNLKNILCKIGNLFNNGEFSLNDFAKILKLIVKNVNFARKTAVIDELKIVGEFNFDFTDMAGKKAIFFVGNIENNESKNNIFFSENEIDELANKNIFFSKTINKMFNSPETLLWSNITSHTKKLFISWSAADNFGKLNILPKIIKKFKNIFPKISIFTVNDFNNLKNCYSVSDIFLHYISNDKKRDLYFLDEYFEERTQIFFQRIKNSMNIKLSSSDNFLKTLNIVNGKVVISASQIEKYFLCPFLYFCNYALYLKPKPIADFSPLEFGNIVHYVLEKIFNFYQKNKKFDNNNGDDNSDYNGGTDNPNSSNRDNNVSNNNSEITTKLNFFVQKYFIKNAGEKISKTNKINYIMKSLPKILAKTIKILIEKNKKSGFSPKYFEIPISKKSIIKPLILFDDENIPIEINGKVDRIDVMQFEQNYCLTIVDYKTGKNNFDLNSVFLGNNLQLLIYMATVLKSFAKKSRIFLPYGIIYESAAIPFVNIKQKEIEEKIDEKIIKELKTSGIAVKNVIPSNNDKIAVKLEISRKDFETVLNYSKKKIVEMIQKLKLGKISPDPLKISFNTSSTIDACRYCQFSTICRSKSDKNLQKIKKIKPEEIIKNMANLNENF